MDNFKINHWTLEYFYFFVMVVYMGMMTINTAAMYTYSPKMSLGAILLPIVLNIIIAIKHKVSLSNIGLQKLLLFSLIWVFCLFVKYGAGCLKSSFILFYAIFVAYIQYKVFKEKICSYYVDVMVVIAKISLVLWLFSMIFPSLASHFFHIFPQADFSTFGYNFMYVFNWMDPDLGQEGRNAGCSWEPGRYAVMLSLGIAISVLKNGVSFKDRNFIWLLLALVTTFSTTGYLAVLVIVFCSYIKKINIKYVFIALLLLIPVYFLVINVPFLVDKISLQLSTLFNLEFYNEMAARTANSSSGEYTYSLERFPSMYFEWKNIINDPMVGYGRTPYYSFFYQHISSNVSLPSGLLKVLSNYGIILGIFFYYILYKSSHLFGNIYHRNSPIMLCLLIGSVSYVIFTIPIFTTFWLYYYFDSNK